MLHLIIFNYLRLLRSKALIICTSFLLIFNLALYFVWVNVNVELFLHWIILASLIVYFVFVNIYCISNTMIDDLRNGVFSLEVRKGLNFRVLMLIKLLVYKSILWFILCLTMFLFFIIIITSNSIKKEQLLHLHVPGLSAILGFDVLITGICLFFGAFLSIKLLAGVTSFLIVPFVFSKALATLHLQNRTDLEITSKVNLYNFLQIQQAAQTNPNGLINYLYNELQFYNQNQGLEVIEKTPTNSSSTVVSGSFDEIKSFIDNYGVNCLNYFLSIGEPLLPASYFNSLTYLNTNASFQLTTSYQQSKIYNFFKDTMLTQDGNENKNYNLNYGATNSNCGESYLNEGVNALDEYISYLQNDDLKKAIIDKYNFTNYDQELNLIKTSLTSIIISKQYNYQTRGFNNARKYLVHFNNDDLVFPTFADYWGDVEQQIFNENWEADAAKTTTWITGGNQVFIRMMVNIIAYTRSFTTNIGTATIKDSIYDLINKNQTDRRAIFATNPMISLPYMSLFSNLSSDPIANDNAVQLLSKGFHVQDLELISNPEFDASNQDYFIAAAKLPINNYKVTKIVFQTWIYYLWYVVIGLFLGFVAHFVYMRKIRP